MVSVSISVSNLHIPGSQSQSQYRKLHIPESQSQSVWYRNFRYFLVGTHLKALQNRNMFENLSDLRTTSQAWISLLCNCTNVNVTLKSIVESNMIWSWWWEHHLFLHFERVALVLGHFATINYAYFFTLKIWDQWGNDEQFIMGSVNAMLAKPVSESFCLLVTHITLLGLDVSILITLLT